MNYSYIMGVDNVDSLDRAKFDIEEIDGNYGVSFEDDYIEEYEDFIKENLRPTYWNEYLGEEIVFIFKMDNGSIKRIVRDELNDEEILDLCRKFAGVDFEDVDTMLSDNEFYARTYEYRMSKKDHP